MIRGGLRRLRYPLVVATVLLDDGVALGDSVGCDGVEERSSGAWKWIMLSRP